MIKVSVYLAGFYLVYRFLLSSDTLYGRNRSFILLSVISSFILPFITLANIEPVIPSFSRVLSEIKINGSENYGAAQATEITPLNPFSLVSAIYFTGLFLMAVKFIADLAGLIFLIVRNKENDDRIIRFNGLDTAGFSAFGYIFINSSLSDGEAEAITAHEQNHLNHRHSLDIVFIEIVSALLWFNPFIYMFSRSLRAVHEYQADQECISMGTPVRNYQKLLMNQIFRSKIFTITNSFSNPSLIKKRMIMMTKKRSNAMANLKLLMVMPVIAGLLIFISSCNENNKKTEIPAEVAPPPPPPPPPAADDAKGDVLFEADVMPVFKGGDNAIIKYIGDNVRYPEKAKEKGITGKVIVRFAVEADGSIGRVSILKGVDPELDMEAFRVVNALPAFEKPAVKDGKNVAVWYTIPINFALQ
jgi:TonB family protein